MLLCNFFPRSSPSPYFIREIQLKETCTPKYIMINLVIRQENFSCRFDRSIISRFAYVPARFNHWTDL